MATKRDYSLYNLRGDIICSGGVKQLASYITDKLGIPCSLDSIYRATRDGNASFGMTVALDSKHPPKLLHGFGEGDKVYKYFHDVPTISFKSMKDCCEYEGITMDVLKRNMYDLEALDTGAVYRPYAITMVESVYLSEHAGEFKGVVKATDGTYLFKYDGRLDLERKVKCSAKSVTHHPLVEKMFPLLNNGIRVITHNTGSTA